MGIRRGDARPAFEQPYMLPVLTLNGQKRDEAERLNEVEMKMETPVQIEFQGMDSSEALRSEIARYVSGLEDRFGRVTACRVVLKAPGEHHREGGLHEVNIRLSLPNGKEVNVDRTPGADERHADVHFAIGDAFKRARRRLQDQVRRLQLLAHERWSRDLFPQEQRAQRRFLPLAGWNPRDVRRRAGGERPAGEHGQIVR